MESTLQQFGFPCVPGSRRLTSSPHDTTQWVDTKNLAEDGIALADRKLAFSCLTSDLCSSLCVCARHVHCLTCYSVLDMQRSHSIDQLHQRKKAPFNKSSASDPKSEYLKRCACLCAKSKVKVKVQ